MKIYVLNGPNLNLLGIREPDLYGRETYAELKRKIKAFAKSRGVRVTVYQTNDEGKLVSKIQEAYRKKIDGIVLNPAAYTHTSVALLDALLAVKIPTVEVHISDVDAREEFRKVSYVRPACLAAVSGHGIDGYFEAIDLLLKKDEAR